MLRSVAALVALALAITLSAATPATAAPYDEALSTPVEDSYYPGKGDPGIDTLHYDLHLTWLRHRRVLNGVAKIRFRATRDAHSFQLDLSSRLPVRRVAVGGVRVGFTHRGKTLRVNRPVTRDGRYTVRIFYRGTPGPVKAPTTRWDFTRVGWHTTRTGQVWTMQEPFGAFTWYPANDQPSDKAMYDVAVTVPGRWVGVSNGKLRSRSMSGGRTTTRWRTGHPASTYLMTLAIGPYKRYRQAGPRGIPMSYWVPRDRPELVQPLLRTPKAMRWLERHLGPYPFDRVGVVVTPSDSAMETQTMITFGAANYEGGSRHVRQTMLHELAHHWYGNTVTPSDWRDVWMNEGMATYLETRFSVDQGWARWGQWQREWRADDQMWRDFFGPPGAYERGSFASINVYFCSALMLDELRKELGTPTFNRLLREWPQQHRDTNQTRETYADWLEARTGKDLGAFFTRWLTSDRSPAR